MPVCCIKNCKSRTGRNNRENYNVLLYYFPKEPELRRQWLEACQRKEEDIKLSCGEFMFQMLSFLMLQRLLRYLIFSCSM